MDREPRLLRSPNRYFCSYKAFGDKAMPDLVDEYPFGSSRIQIIDSPDHMARETRDDPYNNYIHIFLPLSVNLSLTRVNRFSPLVFGDGAVINVSTQIDHMILAGGYSKLEGSASELVDVFDLEDICSGLYVKYEANSISKLGLSVILEAEAFFTGFIMRNSHMDLNSAVIGARQSFLMRFD